MLPQTIESLSQITYNRYMQQFRDKKESAKSAILGICRILTLPKYFLLTIAATVAFAVVIYFAINANFYGPLMMSRLPILDKITLLGSMIIDIFKQSFTSLNGALLMIVSILQGISIAAVIFTANNNRDNEKTVSRQVGLSGIASIAATIGLGCVPCGTSLILPIVTLFFSGATAATAANIASTIVLLLALLLSLFSLYKSGQIIFMYTELSKQEKI